jgi:hypothetical protein
MAKMLTFPTRSSGPRPIPAAPCEHQQITADGRVVCRKVGQGNTEVAVALCATCPAALVRCPHLRFTLRQHAPAPMLVRCPGGRVEAWDDLPPVLRFERAYCALRRGAISSPADCAGCMLRLVGKK